MPAKMIGRSPLFENESNQVVEIVRWFAVNEGSPSAFLRADIVPERISQYQFSEKLRKGQLRRVARVVYYEVGDDKSSVIKPRSVAIAVALCRRFGWTILLPSSLARFWLGLSSCPTDIHDFVYDKKIERHYDDANVTFVPISNIDLFKLSIMGQMLRVGIPDNLTPGQFCEITRQAAGAFSGDQRMVNLLRRDIASGLLDQRQIAVAEAILTSVVSASGSP